MNKKILIPVLVISIVIVIGVFLSGRQAVPSIFSREDALLHVADNQNTNDEQKSSTSTVTSKAFYVTDFSDDRKLVGFSDNIFVGKVIKQTTSKEYDWGPATRFDVEIVYNIKGDLTGIISLQEPVGYRNGKLVLTEDSIGILQSRSIYIFATTYIPNENIYSLNSHPSASKLLSSDSALSNEQLSSLVKQDTRVRMLEVAYPNEIPLTVGTKHFQTKNAFQSLSDEAKATARARAEEARASLQQDNTR